MKGMMGERQRLLIAQVYLGLASFPFYSQHPIQIYIIYGVFLAFPWLFSNLSPKLLKIVKTSFVFFALGMVLTFYGTLRGLEPGLGLLMLVTALKSYELREYRDLLVYYLMTILTLVGHLLNVDQLVFVFYLLMMSYLLLFLLTKQHAQQYGREKKKRQRDLGIIFALAIPQAVVLFLFFPRFYVGNLVYGGTEPKSRVGFIDELDPGTWSEIIKDQTPIFRATFTDQKPPRHDLYWRGAILQKHNGFKWTEGKLPDDLERWGVLVQKAKKERTYQVDYASLLEERLFTLPETSSVTLHSAGRVHYTPGELYRVLIIKGHQSPRYSGVTSVDWPAYDLSEEERASYLQVSGASTRLKNFVREFEARFETDEQKIMGLLEHYRTQPYVYTLVPGSYTSRYPEDEFFFQRRRGFCEHYASVTAMILRMMGIPSRIVTGFQGGQFNPIGEYFVIRGEDAHAWVEAFVPGKGWQLIDPVRAIAPFRIEYGANAFFSMGENLLQGREGENPEMNLTLWGRFVFAVDALYYRANLYFSTYQEERQQSFLELLGIKESTPVKLLFLIGALFLGFFLISWGLTRPARQQRREIDLLFERLCLYFEQQGHKKLPHESAEQFCQRVRESWPPEVRERIDRLFTDYLSLKYGPVTAQYHSLQKAFSQDVKKISSFLGQMPLSRRG